MEKTRIDAFRNHASETIQYTKFLLDCQDVSSPEVASFMLIPDRGLLILLFYMNTQIASLQQRLKNHFNLVIEEEQLQTYMNSIDECSTNYDAELQSAFVIRLLNAWENRSGEKNITLSHEICRIEGGPCMIGYGIISPDWPGLAATCTGALNEMGWNVSFVRAFSLFYQSQTLGIVLLAVRTDASNFQGLVDETQQILDKLYRTAIGNRSKLQLLLQEMRKIEIYDKVITEIEKIYPEDDLEQVVGQKGEAVKFFAARSYEYVKHRRVQDIAQQIITNHVLIKKVRKTGSAIQLDINTFATSVDGLVTGITVAGPSHMLNLEDCLQTIEQLCPNFKIKHNREFTTKQGISLYRIEFVDSTGNPLDPLGQQRLSEAFLATVLNKRRNRAQWIQSIGGFEHFARAIIPLLVKETEQTGKPQVYLSAGQITQTTIDFKVIAVTLPCTDSRIRYRDTMNRFDAVPSFSITTAKPPKRYGNAEVFIIDLRADLVKMESIEAVYLEIKRTLHDALGEFRDFDEGMRTIDTTKLKTIRQHLEGVEKNLIQELYYSLEDFFRISASMDEIVDHLRAAVDMLKRIPKAEPGLLVAHQPSGLHANSESRPAAATLICIAYPHHMAMMEAIMDIFTLVEVTLSRIEKFGWDLLLCRITDQGKALSEEAIDVLVGRLKEIKFDHRKETTA
jgi:hypothetical protein